MREERFLLSRKTVYIYFIFAIPLSILFLFLEQSTILKLSSSFLIAGIAYSLIHKYIFKYVLKGGPNVSSKPEDIKLISELSFLKNNMHAIEIGSGNGHISIALAKKGVNVTGIDINPFAVFCAKINAFVNRAENCKFYVANMWTYDYSGFDAAIVYCIDHAMVDLKQKLLTEMKPGSYLISNYFKFPGLKEDFRNKNIYVYKI